jgi:hypothetical protein
MTATAFVCETERNRRGTDAAREPNVYCRDIEADSVRVSDMIVSAGRWAHPDG